jgi:hypothetical protein
MLSSESFYEMMKIKINQTKNFSFLLLALTLICLFGGATKAQEEPARNEKIVFKTATLSKTGTLRGTDFHDFTFSAKENQKLTLTLTTRQNVNFNLLDKTTMELIEADPSPMQVRDWAGALPKTGEYVIRVFILPRTGPKKRTAAYRLAIAISGTN